MNPTEFVNFSLERLKARLRTNDLLTGLLALLAFVLAWLVVVILLDRAIGLSRDLRLVLVAVLAAMALAGLLVALLWPTVRRLSDVYVARLIESHDENRFRNSVTTFVELRDDASAADDVRRAVAEKAARDLTEMDLDELVRRHWLRRTLVVLATTGAVLLGFGLLSPRTFSTSVGRVLGSAAERPTATRIVQLQPADGYVVAAGSNVVIDLNLGGQLPDEATIHLEHDDGFRQSKPMRRIGDENWQFAVSDLLQDMTFTVQAGDAQSSRHRLIVQPLPQVTSIRCRLFHPAYTRREPQDIDTGHIEALPGSRVEITVLTNHAPLEPVLKFDDGSELPLRVLDDRSGATGSFKVGRLPTGYRVSFRDQRLKLENRGAVQYRVVPTADRSPLVELSPQGPLEMPADGSSRLYVHATDDYGLARLAVEFRLLRRSAAASATPPAVDGPALEHILSQPAEQTLELLPAVPPAPEPLPTGFDRPLTLQARDFAARPGDLLVLRARAEDLSPFSGGMGADSNVVIVAITEPAQEEQSPTAATDATGETGGEPEAPSTTAASQQGDSGEAATGDSGEAATGDSAGQAGTDDPTTTAQSGDPDGNTGDGPGAENTTAGSEAADATGEAGNGADGQIASASGGSQEPGSATGDAGGNSPSGPDDPLADMPAEDKAALKQLLAALADSQNNQQTPSGQPDAEDPAAGTASATATGTASSAGQQPDPAQEETGHSANETASGQTDAAMLAASGPQIRRLAADLERGSPVDPALLKKLGWDEADLRRVVSAYSERFDSFAGNSQWSAATGSANNGAGAAQQVVGRGPLGSGQATVERNPAGDAGSPIVQPPQRRDSPEFSEIIEAYIRAVNRAP